MYLKRYNLTLNPFEISPDQKFLWLGEKHREALTAMKNGILENKGFIFLTGAVGTGKTTLVDALANILGNNIIFAQVADPTLEQLDFLNLTADAFEMNKAFSTQGDFLSQLRHFLNTAYVYKFALSTGYAKEAKIIEPEIIRECAENCLLSKQQKEDGIEDLSTSAKSIPEAETEVQSVTSGNSHQKVSKKGRIKPAGLKLAYIIPIFAVILLSIFGYLYFFGENYAPFRKLITSIGTQLGQLKSSYDEPAANVKELKNVNARVAELESAAAIREQMLSELTEELDRKAAGRVGQFSIYCPGV